MLDLERSFFRAQGLGKTQHRGSREALHVDEPLPIGVRREAEANKPTSGAADTDAAGAKRPMPRFYSPEG